VHRFLRAGDVEHERDHRQSHGWTGHCGYGLDQRRIELLHVRRRGQCRCLASRSPCGIPANTADIAGNVQNFFVPANGNFTVVIPVDVPSNGRVVIRTPTAITGSVQASILKDGPA
jgi:hypothetical protein